MYIAVYVKRCIQTMKNISYTRLQKIIPYIFIFVFCFEIALCDDNMQIEQAVTHYIETYPSSRLQDVYKVFYQDRFGSEHLVKNPNIVLQYINEEVAELDSKNFIPMVEEIGWRHNCVRVNLQLVKSGKITAAQLADAFIETANNPLSSADTTQWTTEWKYILNAIIKNKHSIIDFRQDSTDIDSLLKINPNAAIHHSQEFRDIYHPHYRVVEKSLFIRKFGTLENYK